MPETRTCPKCAAANPGPNQFCAQCGATLAGEGSGSYEFTPAQNEVIRSLGFFMRFLGVIQILFGLLLLLGAIGSLSDGQGASSFLPLVQAALFLAVGGLTQRAGRAFKRIVASAGSDITHLMVGLGALRSLYLLQTILFALVVVLVVIFIIGFIAAGQAGAP